MRNLRRSESLKHLVVAPLCIAAAMEAAISYQLACIWCRLCHAVTEVVVGLHTLMELVAAAAKVDSGVPVLASDVVVAVAVEDLAPALVGKGYL
jgi:hypothetical protein